ncbi:O-phospho-L-seryl-tRNA:Cys-tRNA synthase [Methanoplanus sp. FWC-SCC4]|uniref:O-phospho-L-seryl-tRNA:Cys-tRNA synthase n=1 Tax=Methanochimaera problematica TaxID=2609417 RepID=A0AA97I5B1_9EURY|nr:O-phospho-L-seryl-tRNA:Cys-tRNA synthase [Methanoplanus sp. FWC-SCC4]WOF17264.1 O-phospho-L-seryl-tRNA:Cys-tRNA synthase [Methanoplanus sp. FWC-SCC4]
MDLRIQKTYEALFALEDIREIFRESLPTGPDADGEKEIKRIAEELKKTISDIESGTGQPKVRAIGNSLPIRDREEAYINIQPIQAAGRLTADARKAIISYGDGYSACDQCRKPFRLDKIEKPCIAGFHRELAEFLGMDEARVVPGARRGFQAVTSTLIEKGDIAIATSLSHYTEFLAVENSHGQIREIPADKNNIITADSAAEKIEEVIRKEGKTPKLLMIDHFDYTYANEHDVYGIAKVAKQYDIPLLYNGAYSVGVMPVDGRKIGADFVVGSGHKSMASAAPSGVLAATSEWAEEVFRTTQITGDVTNRRFGIKEVEMLGCTLMGAPLFTMMASFPHVVERTKHWDDEITKISFLLDRMLAIKGTTVLSEYPRKHALTKVDTTDSFDTVSKTHKKRGFYFSSEMSKRGIAGVFPGATKQWKLSTYGLSWEKVRYLADSFDEIAEKYNLEVAK